MSRGGRLVVVAVVAALLASGVAGCARFSTKPVHVAPLATAGDCVVGSWRQTEGWQRITTETLVVEVRLVEGGRRYEIKADGTANYRYADPTKWQNGATSPEVAVLYTGVVTVSYTAVDGKWTQTADTTNSTSQVVFNGKSDAPLPGAPNRTSSSTYLCDDQNLIISSDDLRLAYRRA